MDQSCVDPSTKKTLLPKYEGSPTKSRLGEPQRILAQSKLTVEPRKNTPSKWTFGSLLHMSPQRSPVRIRGTPRSGLPLGSPLRQPLPKLGQTIRAARPFELHKNEVGKDSKASSVQERQPGSTGKNTSLERNASQSTTFPIQRKVFDLTSPLKRHFEPNVETQTLPSIKRRTQVPNECKTKSNTLDSSPSIKPYNDNKRPFSKRSSNVSLASPKDNVSGEIDKEILPKKQYHPSFNTANGRPSSPGEGAQFDVSRGLKKQQGEVKLKNTTHGHLLRLSVSHNSNPIESICEPLKTLDGSVIYLDIKTSDGDDASVLYSDALRKLGAKVVQKWNWVPYSKSTSKQCVTHVVYKDGSDKTLSKVRETKGSVKCVSVAWILECEKTGTWQDENEFLIDIGKLPYAHRVRITPRISTNDLEKEEHGA